MKIFFLSIRSEKLDQILLYIFSLQVCYCIIKKKHKNKPLKQKRLANYNKKCLHSYFNFLNIIIKFTITVHTSSLTGSSMPTIYIQVNPLTMLSSSSQSGSLSINTSLTELFPTNYTMATLLKKRTQSHL